jgi:purine-binding chemotaxis protein CheW
VTESPTSTHRMFCTFRVNDRLFGVDILDVKEVTAETTFTRAAHAPDEVLGLVNIRGYIYLALDLHRLLGLSTTVVTGDSRLVLFKPSVGNAFGVVVDAISDIRTVDASRTESFARADREAVAVGAGRADLIDCICELDGELLVVLNPRRFLAVIEQNLTAIT